MSNLDEFGVAYNLITGRDFVGDMIDRMDKLGVKKKKTYAKPKIKKFHQFTRIGRVYYWNNHIIKKSTGSEYWELRYYLKPERHIIVYASESLKEVLKMSI